MQVFAQMPQAEIRSGFREHAAMAQYFRWYQFYERPEGGIENALNILSDDVTVVSGLGTANGLGEYEARVSQLPRTWKNAHHVKSVDIDHAEGGVMNLTAQIIYQNTGMLPNGAVRAANLNYTIELVPGGSVLPLLSDVNIEQAGEIENAAYEDAYADNRMRSLVHYWLALVEDPARNAAPFKEILADEFVLNFSSGAITEFEGLEAWLAGPGSQVEASTHIIENFSVKETAEETYEVSVDFDWIGILPGGAEMVAKTRHRWAVENDVGERFARIKSMDVEVLEKFRPRDQ